MDFYRASSNAQCKELMDRIYDTLMGNVGMSKCHVPFPAENIINQWVSNGSMYFELWGKAFKVTIQEVEKHR